MEPPPPPPIVSKTFLHVFWSTDTGNRAMHMKAPDTFSVTAMANSSSCPFSVQIIHAHVCVRYSTITHQHSAIWNIQNQNQKKCPRSKGDKRRCGEKGVWGLAVRKWCQNLQLWTRENIRFPHHGPRKALFHWAFPTTSGKTRFETKHTCSRGKHIRETITAHMEAHTRKAPAC